MARTNWTKAYQLFLARWARRLSWKEVADTFQTSWDSVFRSVRYVVQFGLKHRDLSCIEAVGVDEIHYKKGQNYLTLVYQLDQGNKRLLYVAKKRTVKSLLGFFRLIGQEGKRRAQIRVFRYVASLPKGHQEESATSVEHS